VNSRKFTIVTKSLEILKNLT